MEIFFTIPYTNILDNPKLMFKFLDVNNLPRLDYKEIESPNRLVKSKAY
jgi:hypothetical protein